jgi:hypothetical protein
MTRWRSMPPRYSACSVNYLFLTGEIRPDPSLAGLLHPTAPNRIETCRKGGCQPLRRTQHARRAPVRRRCCQASSTLCRHPRAHLLLRSSQHAWRSRPPRNLAAAPGDESNDDEIDPHQRSVTQLCTVQSRPCAPPPVRSSIFLPR